MFDSGNPTTNDSGYYTAAVEHGWSGTVTPIKAGYSFSLSRRIYSNVTSDKANQDYTASAFTPTISGSTKNASGERIEGVTITFSNGGDTSTTASNGDNSNMVNYGWSGTTTPSKIGYTFSPSSRTYANVTSDQTAKDYTAILNTYTLSTLVNTSMGGFITKNPDRALYYHGESVELIAHTNTGYTFSGWTGDVLSGHENDSPLTIIMDSDKSITALAQSSPLSTP